MTALPAVSEARVPEALALLEAVVRKADGTAADSSPDALAANKLLLAVCMRSLPDMLSGVGHMQPSSQALTVADKGRAGLALTNACVHAPNLCLHA